MNGLRYVGGGFLPGVPAKDLTAEQVEQYGGEKTLIASELYEVIDTPQKAKDEKTLSAAKQAGKE